MHKKLDDLSMSVGSLSGVGPKTLSLLKQIGINSLFDLLSHIPKEFCDKSETGPLESINHGDRVVASGQIIKSIRTKGIKPNYIITVKGKLGVFTVRFIHKIIIFMNLQPGTNVRVDGKVKMKKGNIEFIHPEIETFVDSNPLQSIIPTYSLRGMISQKKMRKLILQAFKIFSPNYEFTTLDDYFNRNFNCMSMLKAFKKIHFPEGSMEQAFEEYNSAKKRLIFEEVYLYKHEFLENLSKYEGKKSFNISIKEGHTENFIKNLPFKLTDGQRKALDKVFDSLKSNQPSRVLIQGDVGCGKTIVAVIACLNVVRDRHQCLVLVPTEVLCNQHFKTFSNLLGELGKVAKLSGKHTSSEKLDIKHALKTGTISILIATHALLYDDYEFKSLALVVIDEQHKFGVKQRERITSTYSNQPHLIYMSATPIPRTLALVLYENMNYLKILDKPDSQKQTKTFIYSDNRRQEIYDHVQKHLDNGMQTYWVCTRVEDTFDDSLQSVKVFSDIIKNQFPNYKTAVLHGKLPADEKIKIINDFQSGDIKILVATSVIEVGVDCKNANCLVVENSEMFGISQLHQLRGRVGRGIDQGYCYFIHTDSVRDETIEKLKYLELNTSGFDVAEHDLKMRGSGTYLGTKQSGLPDNYRVTDINDIMNNIHQIKKFTYNLPSARIRELKKRWNIKKIDEVQL